MKNYIKILLVICFSSIIISVNATCGSNIASSCDYTEYEKIRVGQQATLSDVYTNNNNYKHGINNVTVSLNEQYDFNGSPSIPNFSYTSQLISNGYIVNGRDSMTIVSASSPYQVLYHPPERCTDNFVVIYDVSFFAENGPNGTYTGPYTHRECQYFEVYWCGDGVKDPEEQCDPNDPNKTNWGVGGCDENCEKKTTLGGECESLTTNINTVGGISTFNCTSTDNSPSNTYEITVYQGSTPIKTINGSSGSYTFTGAGNYGVSCVVNGKRPTPQACQKNVTVQDNKSCDSINVVRQGTSNSYSVTCVGINVTSNGWNIDCGSGGTRSGASGNTATCTYSTPGNKAIACNHSQISPTPNVCKYTLNHQITETPDCTGLSATPNNPTSTSNMNFTCTGNSSTTSYDIDIYKNGTRVGGNTNQNNNTASYTLTGNGSYTAECKVNGETSADPECRWSFTPTPPPTTCNSLSVNPTPTQAGDTSTFRCTADNPTSSTTYAIYVVGNPTPIKTGVGTSGISVSYTFLNGGSYSAYCSVNGQTQVQTPASCKWTNNNIKSCDLLTVVNVPNTNNYQVRCTGTNTSTYSINCGNGTTVGNDGNCVLTPRIQPYNLVCHADGITSPTCQASINPQNNDPECTRLTTTGNGESRTFSCQGLNTNSYVIRTYNTGNDTTPTVGELTNYTLVNTINNSSGTYNFPSTGNYFAVCYAGGETKEPECTWKAPITVTPPACTNLTVTPTSSDNGSLTTTNITCTGNKANSYTLQIFNENNTQVGNNINDTDGTFPNQTLGEGDYTFRCYINGDPSLTSQACTVPINVDDNNDRECTSLTVNPSSTNGGPPLVSDFTCVGTEIANIKSYEFSISPNGGSGPLVTTTAPDNIYDDYSFTANGNYSVRCTIIYNDGDRVTSPSCVSPVSVTPPNNNNPPYCDRVTASPTSGTNSLTSLITCYPGGNYSSDQIVIDCGDGTDTTVGSARTCSYNPTTYPASYTASCSVHEDSPEACRVNLNVTRNTGDDDDDDDDDNECGDGIKDPGEECDPGNPDVYPPIAPTHSNCRADCTLPDVANDDDDDDDDDDEPYCGDGILDPGEKCETKTCDPNNPDDCTNKHQFSDDYTDRIATFGTEPVCRVDCTLCGDGDLQEEEGENCDFGPNPDDWPDWCGQGNNGADFCELIYNTQPLEKAIKFYPTEDILIGGGMDVIDYTGNPYIENISNKSINIDKPICISESPYTSVLAGESYCSNVGILHPGDKLEINNSSFVGNTDSITSNDKYEDANLKVAFYGFELAPYVNPVIVRVAKPTIATTGGGSSLVGGSDISNIFKISEDSFAGLEKLENKNFIGASVSAFSSYATTVTAGNVIQRGKDEGNDELSGFTSTNYNYGGANSDISTLPDTPYQGLENVFVHNSDVNLLVQSITGNTTYIINGDLTIGGDISVSGEGNILFVVKGGNIIIKSNVKSIDAVIINIDGEIKGDGATTERLVIDGAIYGSINNLLAQRTYMKNNSNNLVDVGTVVNFSSDIFKNPPPLLSKFLGEYMTVEKVAR